MNRKNFKRCISALLIGGVCLGAGLAVSVLINTSARAEDESVKVISIKGTCEFMRQQGTWSAQLTPTDAPDVYDAQYVAAFSMGGGSVGGNHMTYEGQIKSDFKTFIAGSGKSTGGGGNGTFEFSGEYGEDGIAQCNYAEIGGQRSGTLTAGKPE